MNWSLLHLDLGSWITQSRIRTSSFNSSFIPKHGNTNRHLSTRLNSQCSSKTKMSPFLQAYVWQSASLSFIFTKMIHEFLTQLTHGTEQSYWLRQTILIATTTWLLVWMWKHTYKTQLWWFCVMLTTLFQLRATLKHPCFKFEPFLDGLSKNYSSSYMLD